MAWTSPRSYTNGEIITASILDTHVRDNLNAILSSGTTLNSAIVTSSLTQVGTLTALTMGGDINLSNNSVLNVGAAGNDIVAAGYQAVDGAVGAPSFFFGTDTDTGFYLAAAGQIGVAVGGAQSLSISTTEIALKVQINCSNQSLLNIGDAGHDITSAGLVFQSNGAYLAAEDPTNTGVHWVGHDGGVSCLDGETFTFTMGLSGVLFTVTEGSNGRVGVLFTVTEGSNGRVGVFAASWNSATITEIADPSTYYEVTDTDSGGNIAVFKGANSNVISVKNYGNATISIKVHVFGAVATATAPA